MAPAAIPSRAVPIRALNWSSLAVDTGSAAIMVTGPSGRRKMARDGIKNVLVTRAKHDVRGNAGRSPHHLPGDDLGVPLAPARGPRP